MTDLVVWAGPVAKYQAPDASVPGAKELWIQCLGDREPSCPRIGTQLEGDPALLMAKAGLVESDLVLGAFSAGGSVHKRLLRHADYRAMTTAVMLSDATYAGSWASKNVPYAIEGFVLYAVDVANGPGDKLFVATASPAPNSTHPNGVRSLQAIRLEVERRTGRKFERMDDFFGIEPAPENAYRLGNVIFAEYPMKPLGHGGHVDITGQTWGNILQPWLAARGRVPGPGDPPARPTEPSGNAEGYPVWPLVVGAASGLALAWIVGRR